MASKHKAARLLTLALSVLAFGAPSSHAEETLRVNLLDNGDFEEQAPGHRGPRGVVRIPWWRSSHGVEMIVGEAGSRALVTAPEQFAEQPVAAYAPLVEELRVRGEVVGRGVLELRDGAGRVALEVGDDSGAAVAFDVPMADFAQAAGRALTPRFVLRLSATDSPARWDELACEVALPLPSEEELRFEIVEELEWIFGLWLDRCLDDVGEEATGLACHILDVITGERLATTGTSVHPLMIQLRRAAAVEEHDRWRRATDRFLDDLFRRCLHPTTGLPRTWDPQADRPRESPVEIHMMLELLLDVVQQGPMNFRTRALEAAMQIGDHVLERGILPDGNVAASYFPATGEPNPEVSVLRRLDVPAQLARLGRTTEDFRYSRAAREACVTFDFTNFWPGTWDAIDPGWDDNYGHYGERATVMWKAHPDDEAFKRISYGGAVHYHEPWRDALRLGGNVAADQVRCWFVLKEIAELEPVTREEIAALLRMAARSHFKGEQYENGTWGDVTVYDFDPKGNLNVGDLPGTPMNLLHGLAGLYSEELGLRDEETRAMFTAVFRSSRAHYKREFGYLTGRAEVAGHNYGGGEVRFAVGLVEMLRRLSD